MTRPLHPSKWVLAIAACVVPLFARVALGAPKDAAAQKLRQQAIYTDYLATNFAAAENKLTQALAACGDGADCDRAVRARLQCDLASVFFGDRKPDDARAHFLLALEEDPNVALDKDLSSAELQRFFAAAKSAGPAASPAAPALAPAADEGITHAPPSSQTLLTALPIYAELPPGLDPPKVIVRFNAPSVQRWKTVQLRKMASGWGGEIACTDVGDSVGDLKYFIQAIDENGVVASSGRLLEPHVVRIVQSLEGDAPHLPGQPPPAPCAAKTDCPPGFPGCHAEAEKTSCVSDDECSPGQACRSGLCEDTGEPVPEVDAPFKRNWVSVAFQADLLLVPAQNDACAGGTGYTCFDSSGNYDARYIPLPGADDIVTGGAAMATMRVLLGYDRVFGQNVTAGARAGFAFNGGPQRPGGAAFLPVHAEARGAYWFGHNPFGRSGFRFFGFAGVGMAEVDASVAVDTFKSSAAVKAGSSDNWSAWKKTGQGFAEVGPGVMYAVTPNSGVLVEAKAMAMFPTSAFGIGVQLGYSLGL